MSTKPFNLADALAGKPVVTRDGRKVTYIHDTKQDVKFPLIVKVEGYTGLIGLSSDGGSSYGSSNDLLMATTTVTKYINVYRDRFNNVRPDVILFDFEESAKGQVGMGEIIATVPVTWEE